MFHCTHLAGHFLHAVDDPDVVEAVDAGAEAAVQAEDLAAHHRAQREKVEQILERIGDLNVAASQSIMMTLPGIILCHFERRPENNHLDLALSLQTTAVLSGETCTLAISALFPDFRLGIIGRDYVVDSSQRTCPHRSKSSASLSPRHCSHFRFFLVFTRSSAEFGGGRIGSIASFAAIESSYCSSSNNSINNNSNNTCTYPLAKVSCDCQRTRNTRSSTYLSTWQG